MYEKKTVRVISIGTSTFITARSYRGIIKKMHLPVRGVSMTIQGELNNGWKLWKPIKSDVVIVSPRKVRYG
jgi:hypothetical protein